MQILTQAAKGNRAALTELFEKHWREVKALCDGLLLNETYAENAVVRVFKHIWNDISAGQIKTEEELRQKLYEKAAIYCRRKYQKKGQSSLPVPAENNFLITDENDTLTGRSIWDAMRLSLPLAGRFVFVLHRAADFDKKQISEVTGLKHAVTEAALAAEEQNLARICSITGREHSRDTGANLEQEIRQAVTNATLSETARKQILDSIDALAAPLEKKKKKKKRTRTGIAAAAAFAAVFFFIIGKTWFLPDKPADESSSSVSDENPADNSQNDHTAAAGASEITATHYAEIVIEDYGTITVALDANTAPVTVKNFVSLAEKGFYNGLTFHRIMEGFVMQGGDPEGNGFGGSGNTIFGEFKANGYENPLSHTRGAISMARSSDYNSADSQFFIVHEDSVSLDGDYAVFGYVTEGMDVVDQVCTSAKPADNNGTIPADEQPVITSITIKKA